MSISSSPMASVSARKRWWRIPVILLLLVALVIVVGLGWGYVMLRSTLPQVDGQLNVPGLNAAVTVSRDGRGVPTIEAANMDDLFFTQGFVTAQDRLWQMDGMRRFAGGELAEILGEDLVKLDRRQRILGLREAARKTVELASPQVRANFEAYARGVNAYIALQKDNLPIEFRILGYKPRTWTPVDSALIGAQMVEDLSTSPRPALAREKILAKIGPELTADLYVNTSAYDRPPTVSHATPEQNSDDEDEDEGTDSLVAETERPMLPFSAGWRTHAVENEDPRFVVGSNNWVVSGAHTTTGRPLLSNDMHLGHQMPNLWYEAHLRSGSFDVAGVTLPGVPYVVVGHNQRIAWGFTNIGPTVEDAYVETFNRDGNYLTPEGWKAPQHRSEVIKVKGKPDVVVDVVVTRHGPIVTELQRGETRKLALRWTLYDGVRNPFFAVDSAQNWNDFRQAFSQLDAPGQNAIYADVDGNIGYQATGKIPIRASGDGSLPEDGSTDKYEWTGYIPFEKLPSVFNPPSGIIATANSRIAPDNYPYSISVEWEAPWRTARIYRVLESGKKFAAADMLSLQTDIDSEFDRMVAANLVTAVDHAKNPSAKAKAAVEILRGWDGRMSADSAAPTIAVRAREELKRLLLEPKLGAVKDKSADSDELNWKTYDWLMESIWLNNVLQQRPKRWLPDSNASYDDLLAAAVEAVVNKPNEASDLRQWQWGYYNRVNIQHPIFGRIPILRRWTGTGLQPQSGSIYTVKAVSSTHGPSERLTVDLANLDRTTLNVVTGQAGNIVSSNYMDQWKAWYGGTTFTLPFSEAASQAAQIHRLQLNPSK